MTPGHTDFDDAPSRAPESGEPRETGPKSLKHKPVGAEAPPSRRPGDRNTPPD